MTDDTRRFRVIWVRDEKNTRGVFCPGPLTHDEACTILRKCEGSATSRYCRILLEEIQP